MKTAPMLSIKDLTLIFPRPSTAFWDWMASKLKMLGNRDGFLPAREGMICEFRNLSLQEGQCYAICGRDSFVGLGLLNAIEARSKIASGIIVKSDGLISTQRCFDKKAGATIERAYRHRPDFEALLSFSDLFAQANIAPNDLSGVEKARLSIAEVLFSSEKLVLIDERLFGCDKEFVGKVLEKIKLEKSKGRSFILVAPEWDAVKSIADKAIPFKVTLK